LIILDATLPDMDGTTVCEILHCLPSTTTVPRILLAARPKVFSQAAAIRGGSADGVIAPFNTVDLLRRVNQMLAPATSAPETIADPDAAWETRAGFA
jgi:DNA-binding response OmpR family regulator